MGKSKRCIYGELIITSAGTVLPDCCLQIRQYCGKYIKHKICCSYSAAFNGKTAGQALRE